MNTIVLGLNEVNHTIDVIGKLESFIENAYFNYDMAVLNEASSDEIEKPSTAKESAATFKAAGVKSQNAVQRGLEKVWNAIIDAITKLMDIIRKFIRGGNDAKMKEDITVSPYCFGTMPVVRLIGQICKSPSEDVSEALLKEVKELRDADKKTISKGSDAKLSSVFGYLDILRKEVRKISKELGFTPYENKRAALQELRVIVKEIISDSNRLIANATAAKNMMSKEEYHAQKVDEKFDRISQKISDKDAKAAAKKAKKSQNESIDFGDMTRNEFIASLMLEAAELLKDDVVRDDTPVKEFDDIPEEKPVVQDEYIPDVNGGEGEKVDLEEIKDLCDGDKEVMDLLLDDEDKSVTVDASNEAVDFFNLDF